MFGNTVLLCAAGGGYSLAEPYISQIFWDKTISSFDWYAYFAIAKIYGDKLADYLIYELANDPNKIQLTVYDARYFGFIVGQGDSGIPQTSIRFAWSDQNSTQLSPWTVWLTRPKL